MNAIEDMRARLSEQFRGGRKPAGGFNIQAGKAPVRPKPFRPTANDAPRLPQSRIANPKPRYDRVGRPAKETQKRPPVFREKPKFGAWR